MRALLIDDSRLDRLVVRAALALKGPPDLRLTETADLDLGLSLLLQRRFDLILLNDPSPEVYRAVRGVAPVTPVVWHAQCLDDGAEDGDGPDVLVGAVCAALGQAGWVRPSSASGSWASACAAS